MFELRNPQIEELQRNVGRQISSMLPKGWGFALFMFDYQANATFYISSAEREGVLLAIKQWVAKQENDPRFDSFLSAVERACSFVEAQGGANSDTEIIRSFLLAQ